MWLTQSYFETSAFCCGFWPAHHFIHEASSAATEGNGNSRLSLFCLRGSLTGRLAVTDTQFANTKYFPCFRHGAGDFIPPSVCLLGVVAGGWHQFKLHRQGSKTHFTTTQVSSSRYLPFTLERGHILGSRTGSKSSCGAGSAINV